MTDIVIVLSSWVADPRLRGVAISFFLAGVAVGFVCGKYAFGFLRWLIERRDRRRENEEQRRRGEEDRRRVEEAYASFAGFLFDREGNACCPFHRTLLTNCGSRSSGRAVLYSGYCPGCGKMLFASAPENEVNCFVDCLIEEKHNC